MPSTKIHVLQFRLISVVLLAAAGMVFCTSAQAQSVDIVYGIEYGTGSGGNNQTWNLDQIAVNVNAGGTATSYTVQTAVNLTTLVPTWNAAGHDNQALNALALDPTTNTLFFTYSYNNNASASAGTFTAISYALRDTNSGWVATQINTYTEASGAAGTAGVIGSGGAAGSTSVGAGWFTKGAYYNGSYYVGIQESSDNLVQFTLGPGENSVTQGTVYTNINHTGGSASEGGDLVINGSGTLYMSGENGGTGSTFATETLANAENSGGSAWNAATSGSDSLYFQLAGLGQIPYLFAYSSTLGEFGQITNFTNPSGTTPTFTDISGPALVTFADMSDGSNHSILTPEPATVAAGLAGLVAVVGAFVSRKTRGGRAPCPVPGTAA